MMNISYFQKGFNYSQDGRGNRLVYHLQGCNMRCPWCANPEGLDVNGVLMTDPQWLTEGSCSKGAVRDGVLDRKMCRDCTDRPCINGYRQKGIRLSCKQEEVGDIVKECLSCSPMFFDGGGVTLTGGEMSLQLEAVKELLTALGKEGIHRCIETNGTNPRAEELFLLVDEWIMDCKHWDGEKHREWLGIGTKQIKKTLEASCAAHPDVLIRIPLMPGFNDSKEDALSFAEYLKPFAVRENVRLEVLTYHEFGKEKWERCGMSYRMKGGQISREQREFLEQSLRDAGMRVVST